MTLLNTHWRFVSDKSIVQERDKSIVQQERKEQNFSNYLNGQDMVDEKF